MRLYRVVVTVALTVAVTHAPAVADPRRGSGDGFRHHGGSGDGSWGHRRHGQPFPHHRGFMRHPRTLIILAPSPVLSLDYVSPPAYAAAPPIYMPAPVSYPTAATFALPPAMPRVVEHPTGRYELRGDGVTSPYVWVWIPNPPAAPPPAPPVAPPAAAEPAPARAVSRPQTLYRWTDERGVTTWTDDLEKVPAQHRAHARATPP
jgi:hypothetical protein